MSLVILLEIAFIVVIGVLIWYSRAHDGFYIHAYSPITSFSDIYKRSVWASQFRWTLLPAVILSMFSHCYATMVAATAERQPYVELNHNEDGARNAHMTILLDYPAMAIFYSWAVAWYNRHGRLGCAIIVQLVASIILVPLANNLFRVNDADHTTPVHLASNLKFNVLALKPDNAFAPHLGANLVPAIQVASAVHSYGAAPPSWITTKYAVERLKGRDQTITGNITVNSTVYFVNLDCESIPQADITIDAHLINFEDRGCSVYGQELPITSNTPIYALSLFQRCFGVDSWKDRIGVFLARYSSTAADNIGSLVTVSCIPSYRNATATVNIDFGADGSARIQLVDIIESSAIESLYFRTLHSNLPLFEIFDPAGARKADIFGQAVYDFAEHLSINGTFGSDAEAAVTATQMIYQTMFAELTETRMLTHQNQEAHWKGTLISQRPRLYVVVPVAAALISLLGLMLLCSTGLFLYACQSTSVLREEPLGLLGRAGVLYQSDVWNDIKRFYAIHGHDEKLVETISSQYTVQESKCWYAPDSLSKIGRIHVRHLKRRGWIPSPKGLRKARAVMTAIMQMVASWMALPFSKAFSSRRRKHINVGKRRSSTA